MHLEDSAQVRDYFGTQLCRFTDDHVRPIGGYLASRIAAGERHPVGMKTGRQRQRRLGRGTPATQGRRPDAADREQCREVGGP